MFEQSFGNYKTEAKTTHEMMMERLGTLEAKIDEELKQVQVQLDSNKTTEQGHARDVQALKNMFETHKTFVHDSLKLEKTSLEEFMNEYKIQLSRRFTDERQAR